MSAACGPTCMPPSPHPWRQKRILMRPGSQTRGQYGLGVAVTLCSAAFAAGAACTPDCLTYCPACVCRIDGRRRDYVHAVQILRICTTEIRCVQDTPPHTIKNSFQGMWPTILAQCTPLLCVACVVSVYSSLTVRVYACTHDPRCVVRRHERRVTSVSEKNAGPADALVRSSVRPCSPCGCYADRAAPSGTGDDDATPK